MKIPVFVCAQKNSWDSDFQFRPWGQDMTTAGYTLVHETEIEIPEPDRALLVNGAVDALRKKQQELRAEAENAIVEIDRQIGELLCIESKPEMVTE